MFIIKFRKNSILFRTNIHKFHFHIKDSNFHLEKRKQETYFTKHLKFNMSNTDGENVSVFNYDFPRHFRTLKYVSVGNNAGGHILRIFRSGNYRNFVYFLSQKITTIYSNGQQHLLRLYIVSLSQPNNLQLTTRFNQISIEIPSIEFIILCSKQTFHTTKLYTFF